MPVGENRPQPVDVRVIAATTPTSSNAWRKANSAKTLLPLSDPYSRSPANGAKLPPRDLFCAMRPSALAPDTHGADVLDLFAQHQWPGNVRNSERGAASVAMAPAGGTMAWSTCRRTHGSGAGHLRRWSGFASRRQTLASVVDEIERDLIREMLARHRGNISETARALGLTRRGLYLKLRRLGLENASDVITK